MTTPFFDQFNQFGKYIRFCTPSIHPELPRVSNIYDNDMSISLHSIGNPLHNTGVFKEMTDLASKAYGSDHTLYCVQGTTVSNFMVLKALKNQLHTVRMLGTRNAHISIITGCEDYGIEFISIDPRYDDDLQIFVPNNQEDILEAVRIEKPNVLFLSNPTYEGYSLPLAQLIYNVRSINRDIIIYVDEGWGAHFHFNGKLPIDAMDAGADISTQSTHKQGNTLQMCSMIHWRDGRINKQEIYDSYRSLSTTSPSFHLFAAMDATRDFMEKRGQEEIDKIILLASKFFVDVNHTIGGTHGVEIHRFDDPTKLLLHFPNYDATEIAHRLEKKGVVVEKYEAKNITIVIGFQNTELDINITIDFLKQIMAEMKPEKLSFPKFPTGIHRPTTNNLRKYPIATPLDESVALVCGENIIPYPPGIPLISKNEVIRKEHIEYIKAVQKNPLMTLFISDPNSIKTL